MNAEQLEDVINAAQIAVREAIRLTNDCDHPGLQDVKGKLVEVFDDLETLATDAEDE